MRPSNGPHCLLVTQVWPPLELSTSYGSQHRCGEYFVGAGVWWERSGTSTNSPGLERWM